MQEDIETKQEGLTCNKGPQTKLSEGNLAFRILDKFEITLIHLSSFRFSFSYKQKEYTTNITANTQ